MSNSNSVAIVSQAASFPTGDFGNVFSTAEDILEQIPSANRRLQRYMSDSAASAIAVAGAAMTSANIKLDDEQHQIGIYASQHGYLNPHLREFTNTLSNTLPDNEKQAYVDLWNGQEISPFVVTKMLSNNLLAILSLHFGIRGDCAALIRDSAGSSAALLEAMHSVQDEYCQSAVVVSAGCDEDFVQNYFDNKTSNLNEVDVGAVSFILQNSAYAKSNGLPILGILQDSISGYSLDNVLAQIHDQIIDINTNVEVVIDLNSSEQIQAVQQKFGQLHNVSLTDMKSISGARGCDSCLTLLHAALLEKRQDKNTLLVVLNGSKDDHFSSVIVSQDV